MKKISFKKKKNGKGKTIINVYFDEKKKDFHFNFDDEKKLVHKCPLYQNYLKVEKVNLEIIIDNHFELFCKIQECMKCNQQGSRFGNPILDIQRELYRYFNPDFDKKFDDSKYKEIIKEKLLDSLIDSSKKKK